MSTANHNRTKTLVSLALFTAIVVALQFLGQFIKLGPFSISLVNVPIVIGAVLYGPAAGAYLGAVFGVAVLLTGDASAFMVVTPLGTILTVMVKGIACGFMSGLFYRLLKRVNDYFSMVVAAVICPIVNTGVFLLGCLLFFMEPLGQWAANSGFDNVGTYMIVGLVGMNFIVELLINAVFSPVIVRIIRIGRRLRV